MRPSHVARGHSAGDFLVGTSLAEEIRRHFFEAVPKTQLELVEGRALQSRRVPAIPHHSVDLSQNSREGIEGSGSCFSWPCESC